MSCVLRIGGRIFDVDEFVANTNLKIIATFASAVNIVVSDAGFGDLHTQIADATEFLRVHEAELKQMKSRPRIDLIELDFGLEERDVAAQSETFPPNLLAALGQLGIALRFTLYPAAEGSKITPLP